MPALGRWLLTLLAGIFWDKLLVFARSIVEVWITRYEIKQRAQDAVTKMRAAKTGAEISDATKSSLDDL